MFTCKHNFSPNKLTNALLKYTSLTLCSESCSYCLTQAVLFLSQNQSLNGTRTTAADVALQAYSSILK